jgi:lysozyme
MSEFIEKLSERLEVEEGCELYPYQCTADVLTIGIGRAIGTRGITKDEALYMLKTDIEIITNELNANFPWWKDMSENRRLALADLAFNLGMPKLKAFKRCLAHMEEGNYPESAIELLDSNYARQLPARSQRNADLIREG